jgi:hypothetical protein
MAANFNGWVAEWMDERKWREARKRDKVGRYIWYSSLRERYLVLERG